MAAPSSTYRLQVRPAFDLDAVAAQCAYLAALGAGAAYLSPILPSAAGSDHGYDVIAFDTIDPQRGGPEAFDRAVAAARAAGLQIVVDIVPNHAGVDDPTANPAWWDVLRLGHESPFARWFDIDWGTGPLLIPVLGDDFEPSQLEVVEDELRYFEHRYPIAPGTGPEAGGDAAAVHERQHYRLVSFRRADTEQNYRRFFAVTSLAGLRVEDEEVFAATHAEIARWVHEYGVEGLRVDHPDGLVDPLGYLVRLRALAGPDCWITVEKILEPGEPLPTEWPVGGTTGYDALAEVGQLFVDPSAEAPLERTYRELTGDDADFAEHVRRGKRMVVDTILRAEVRRLARLVPTVENAEAALAELLVAFPVYRSYLPLGAEYLAEAIATAQAARTDLADAVAALASRLADPADELCARFQQTSGAVMAKGVEDTAYYRYTRFIALNEVGGNPARFGSGLEDFHEAQLRRQANWPAGMTTLSTHDTKRGEDVRARLAVLSELPEEWSAAAADLLRLAPVPDPAFGYLLWQTFAGTGFIERDRMHAYVEKAMREAGTRTGWIDPDAQFEAEVHGAVDAAYDRSEVRDVLRGLIERISAPGRSNALSQKLVQLTMPGVPDVYQGTELWEDSLVDPDNRRAVDYGARAAELERLDGGSGLPPVDATGRAKLWVTAQALRLRRDRPELFAGYSPLQASGDAAEHAVAFDRGGAITVATRLPVGLERRGGWGETSLDVGTGVTDLITGRRFDRSLPLARVLESYPVALLVRASD